MEKTTEDRALMQALAPKEPRQLQSNFPYLTMRRIKEEQCLEERRQRLFAIISIVVVSLIGISALLFFIGDVLWQTLVCIFNKQDTLVLVLPTLFCLAFFALVNHWLYRKYHVQSFSD